VVVLSTTAEISTVVDAIRRGAADIVTDTIEGYTERGLALTSGRTLDADIVVTATGSQRPIITRTDVEAATGRRRSDPLFIIDIAVPRDVDPAVGEIEQVFLYNVDDLQSIVHENLAKRGAEIARAEGIVAEELARFTSWHRSRRAIPTVVALRQRFDEIRRAELRRLDAKLGGLPPETRMRLDEVTRLIVEKLLLKRSTGSSGSARMPRRPAQATTSRRRLQSRDETDTGPECLEPVS
jgi:glutamyl-tRNA reductase